MYVSLPAFRIDRHGGPLYLNDYDLDGNLYTLLHETWKLEIADIEVKGIAYFPEGLTALLP
jgi:hypothetical protein